MFLLRLVGLFLTLLAIFISHLFYGNILYPVVAYFGVLIYFYYTYQKHAYGLKTMAFHAGFAFIGFGILLFIPQIIILKAAVLAFIAFLVMLLEKRFFPTPVGPFFVIMIASLGGVINVSPAYGLGQMFYLFIGMFFSFIAAYCVEYFAIALRLPLEKVPPVMVEKESEFLSSFYGLTLFLVYFINLFSPYSNYNWLTVAAAANLKADWASKAVSRYCWYIVGNIAGMFLVWIISLFNPPVVIILLLAMFFFMMVAIVININYGLALAMATPLAILLFAVLHGIFYNELIIIRFTSIIIGSFIGLVADLFIINGLRALRKNKTV